MRKFNIKKTQNRQILLKITVGAQSNKFSSLSSADLHNFDCTRFNGLFNARYASNAGWTYFGKSSIGINFSSAPRGFGFKAGTLTSSKPKYQKYCLEFDWKWEIRIFEPFFCFLNDPSGNLHCLLLIKCEPCWNNKSSKSKTCLCWNQALSSKSISACFSRRCCRVFALLSRSSFRKKKLT